MNGKGDKSRITDYKQYRSNYGDIDWGRVDKQDKVCYDVNGGRLYAADKNAEEVRDTAAADWEKRQVSGKCPWLDLFDKTTT